MNFPDRKEIDMRQKIQIDGYDGAIIITKRKDNTIVFASTYDDSCTGAGGEISLNEFLSKLNITLEDCKKALAEKR